MSGVDPVELEVAALGEMDLQALRKVWAGRYGAPPTLRSPSLLRLMIAYRIQSDRYGDLDADTRLALRRGGSGANAVATGTKLAREWRGVVHSVEALHQGFLYEGRTYRSLSAIASEIAGSRWNGRRFFGLDKAAG